MILITAATGEFGPLVVDRLLQHIPAHKLAVAVRNPEKAAGFAERGVEVRHADYDDAASLRAAFSGVERLLFISSPAFDNDVRIPQHERVVDAARDAGVGHVVYTSIIGGEGDLPFGFHAHYVTERALERSGLPYTFLRNAFYTDSVIPGELLRSLVDAGELRGIPGVETMNTATRADLAEAAAAVLTGEGHAGKAYELTGTPWSFSDLADALTSASGRQVIVQEGGKDDGGAWGWLAGVIAGGAYASDMASPDLERLLGHPPATLKEYVASALERAGD